MAEKCQILFAEIHFCSKSRTFPDFPLCSKSGTFPEIPLFYKAGKNVQCYCISVLFVPNRESAVRAIPKTTWLQGVYYTAMKIPSHEPVGFPLSITFFLEDFDKTKKN